MKRDTNIIQVMHASYQISGQVLRIVQVVCDGGARHHHHLQQAVGSIPNKTTIYFHLRTKKRHVVSLAVQSKRRPWDFHIVVQPRRLRSVPQAQVAAIILPILMVGNTVVALTDNMALTTNKMSY